MPTDVDTAFPEVPLAPGTTITVTMDDASAVIETLNVYGVSPAPVRDGDADLQPFVPMFTYGDG